MVRVQCCGVSVWGAGTSHMPKEKMLFWTFYICLYLQEQLYLISHQRVTHWQADTDTDNTENMSKVGQVFADRKKEEDEQQQRNKSKVNWNVTGKRTGEKQDRNERNRRRQEENRKHVTTK